MTIPEHERMRVEDRGAVLAPGTAEADANADATSMAAAPPPRRGRMVLPIPVVAIIAALLIAAAAYTGYWLFAAMQLEARLASWIEERQAEGFRISHGGISRSGFPGRVRLSVAAVDVAAPAGWSWRSPRIDIKVSPMVPQPVRLRLFGAQEVQLPPGQAVGAFTAEADRLTADVTAGGGVPVGTAIAENLRLRAKGGGDTDSLRIGRIEVVAAANPAAVPTSALGGRRYSLAVADLVLPQAEQAPLGDRINRLSLQTEVIGELAPRPWPEALARWRDDGGTVEIHSLAFDYGPLRLTGEGTVALDRTGEPIGAFSVQARGLTETMRALAEKGLLTPAIGAGAAFILRPPRGQDGGEPQTMTVPLSVQDRRLYLGPLSILRVPSPPWVPLPPSGS